mgnify:CR=1 FL=1|jgi:hypothetical protein|tara:strand:+ start:86 stop:406 length:321 start_codon:yes stop_codon:yes gene_type:complete
MANNYKNAKIDLINTNLTNVITTETKSTVIIKSIIVSEDSGSTPTLTLTLVNGSNIFNLYKDKTFSSKQTLELLTQPLVLSSGEILKAQSSAGNQLHIVVSYLEIT